MLLRSICRTKHIQFPLVSNLSSFMNDFIPISSIEFSAQMKKICLNTKDVSTCKSRKDEYSFAVAVSGGADSIALCILMRDWLQTLNKPSKLFAITVDHKLRSESSIEAEMVNSWMNKLGIKHLKVSCIWDSKPPTNKLQNRARNQRYRILEETCQLHGINHLAIGHHYDDQLETILMRIGRASGLNGLRGISAQTTLDSGVRLIRPLLPFRKNRIIATCRNFQQLWIDDPSNDSELFDRVRVRKALKNLPKSKAERLFPLIDDFNESVVEVSDEFEMLESRIRREYVRQKDDRSYEIMLSALGNDWIFEELMHWVLSNLIREVGEYTYSPRLSSVKLLYDQMKHGVMKKRYTLGGCLIGPVAGTRFRVIYIRQEAKEKNSKQEL